MKILVRLPNWLGDVVMSTAFIGAVKQLYPLAQVDVIIKKELQAIATLIPGLTRIHSFSKDQYRGLGGVYRYGKTLRAEKYDMFFTLPDSLSAAVMGKATGAKQRIGFSKEGGFFLLTKVCKRPANVHRVDEYLSILEQVSEMPITGRKVMLNATEVKPTQLILLNFNSEATSRRMPLDKGKGLLNLLTTVFPDLIQLVSYSFLRYDADALFVILYCVDGYIVNLKIQLCCKPDGAHHPQGIIRESLDRV